MTFRISQRGKEYLETAQTLLRAAQMRVKKLADERNEPPLDDETT